MKFDSLRVDSLDLSYRGRPNLLKGLYLELAAGEVIGLLGRNGSGKSSLLGCLTLFHDFGGQFQLNGRWMSRQLRAQVVAWLPQTSFLPPSNTVADVVSKMQADPIRRRAILSDPRLAALTSARCRSLSGGEARWLEFLLVDSLNKPVPLLDEPFAELEPRYEDAICQHLAENRQGRAWLISDHNYRAVSQVASRTLVLVNGQLVEANSPDALLRLGYLKSGSP